jgi:hypothetical protein
LSTVRERDKPVPFVADKLPQAGAVNELARRVAVNDVALREEITNHEL